jgi:hypothetical protein
VPPRRHSRRENGSEFSGDLASGVDFRAIQLNPNIQAQAGNVTIPLVRTMTRNEPAYIDSMTKRHKTGTPGDKFTTLRSESQV